MLDREANSNSSDVVTTLINLQEKQAVFVPKGPMDDFTDPSYHLPHFYQLWAVWDQQHREFWQQPAVTSHVLSAVFSPSVPLRSVIPAQHKLFTTGWNTRATIL